MKFVLLKTVQWWPGAWSNRDLVADAVGAAAALLSFRAAEQYAAWRQPVVRATAAPVEQLV